MVLNIISPKKEKSLTFLNHKFWKFLIKKTVCYKFKRIGIYLVTIRICSLFAINGFYTRWSVTPIRIRPLPELTLLGTDVDEYHRHVHAVESASVYRLLLSQKKSSCAIVRWKKCMRPTRITVLASGWVPSKPLRRLQTAVEKNGGEGRWRGR